MLRCWKYTLTLLVRWVQCTEGTQGTLNQLFQFANRDLIYLHEICWVFAGYLPALEHVIRYLVVTFWVDLFRILNFENRTTGSKVSHFKAFQQIYAFLWPLGTNRYVIGDYVQPVDIYRLCLCHFSVFTFMGISWETDPAMLNVPTVQCVKLFVIFFGGFPYEC